MFRLTSSGRNVWIIFLCLCVGLFSQVRCVRFWTGCCLIGLLNEKKMPFLLFLMLIILNSVRVPHYNHKKITNKNTGLMGELLMCSSECWDLMNMCYVLLERWICQLSPKCSLQQQWRKQCKCIFSVLKGRYSVEPCCDFNRDTQNERSHKKAQHAHGSDTQTT